MTASYPDGRDGCDHLSEARAGRYPNSPSAVSPYTGVALHPSDLTYAPPQQLIRPSIEDPLEISQVTLAALLGACGCL